MSSAAEVGHRCWSLSFFAFACVRARRFLSCRRRVSTKTHTRTQFAIGALAHGSRFFSTRAAKTTTIKSQATATRFAPSQAANFRRNRIKRSLGRVMEEDQFVALCCVTATTRAHHSCNALALAGNTCAVVSALCVCAQRRRFLRVCVRERGSSVRQSRKQTSKSSLIARDMRTLRFRPCLASARRPNHRFDAKAAAAAARASAPEVATSVRSARL